MRMLITICFVIFSTSGTYSQHQIIKAEFLNAEIEPTTLDTIIKSLDSVLSQADTEVQLDKWIAKENAELSKSLFRSWMTRENGNNSVPVVHEHLINVYSLGQSQFFLTFAMTENNVAQPSAILSRIVNLIAIQEKGRIKFTVPLNYLTRYWAKKSVGNITFYSPDIIDKRRATIFNKKNSDIARKLGLKPEAFRFYMCSHFQEILPLLGYGFDKDYNGIIRDGYGIDGDCIFAIMKNEDFSHDLVHYYLSKIRNKPVNGIVEEGIAYRWGNAYYTNQAGEMITFMELVKELRKYLEHNTDANLLEIFKTKPPIFNQYAKEVSVKSVISGLLSYKIEKERGIEGIKTLVNCGTTEHDFFNALKILADIDQSNFDTAVRVLLDEYRE